MKDTEVPHVTTAGFKDHLRYCREAGVNAGVLGNPGNGKTAIVEQTAAEEKGTVYSGFSISGLAPDQVRGFMMPGPSGITEFQKPAILAELPDEGQSVLAIDEVNAINNEMFAAFFELFGSRRIGQYRVPDGCSMVGTGNLLTNRGVARPMPTPFANRFSWVIYTGPTLDEWLDHMGDSVHPIVEAFLARDKSYLCGQFNPKDNLNPTPRSWDYTSALLYAGDKVNADADARMRLIASTVGMKTSTMLAGLNKYIDKLPTMEEILAKPKTVMLPSISEDGGMQAQYYLASFMARNLANVADKPFEEREPMVNAFTAYSNRFEREILFSYYTKVSRTYKAEAGFKTVSHILNQPDPSGGKVRDGHVGEMIKRIAGA